MKKSRISLMVWIKENISTSAQKEFCSLIIYSRLPSNARRNLAPTDALRWRNTWGTWEKRTSGMSSCITPASVAGEKRRCKTGVIRPKKKKTFKEKNSQKHGNRLRRRAARRWKKGCGDKSEQRCLAVNQLSSSLFIYLFRHWQIPS